MKICVIGTGYVGLVVGTCLAELGNKVICVDNDVEKLSKLKKGIIPIFEPGLEELILNNVTKNRLEFSNDLDYAVKNSFICYIAVGTPQIENGSADLKYVYDVVENIAKSMNDYKIIVNKSTVPIGTGEKIKNIIKSHTNYDFDIVSNPEFLKQGSAVKDFFEPDRIIVGADSIKAIEIIKELYFPLIKMEKPIITMDIKSAEMTKYASNAFLALKISFANEIANLCEAIGADAEKVRIGMCSDKRIGSEFLYAGLGYGGSCFPKDVRALTKIAEENNCKNELLKAIDFVNNYQRQIFINKITNKFGNNLKNVTFAVWGLAFKPNTNDMREAPSITIINELLKKGAKIQAYDPKAFDYAKNIWNEKIIYSQSSYDALKNADALLVLTEWSEFSKPDFNKVKSLMKRPIIFDGRNQYNANLLIDKGFEYKCIGKKF